MKNADNKFYIDHETADLITIANLRNRYNCLEAENAELENLDQILEHNVSDLVYNLNVLKALKVVLNHYGVDIECF